MVNIGICTDSGAQLPADLAARLGIEVVPLTVRVGEQEFLEGELDADTLYELLAADDNDVQIVPPSPGQCAVAYEELAASGCESIIAVHSSNGGCNTLSAARLAARAAPVPVRIVDCGTISFGIGCAALAVADALVGGAGVDDAVSLAESIGQRVVHFYSPGLTANEGTRGYALFEGFSPDETRLGWAPTTAEAAQAIAGHVLAQEGVRLRIGVGAAGAEAVALADRLAASLEGVERPLEIVRYRIGAGVARRLRPGTVGCFVVSS